MRSLAATIFLLAMPGTAGAQGIAGRWIAGGTRVTHSVTKNEGMCPSRPASEPGGAIDVREEGGELVFGFASGARSTRDCWTDNPAARRGGHSKGPPGWSTSCATGADDPRRESGRYSFSLSEDGFTITIRLQTDYAVSVAGSDCEGRFTVTRTLRSANAPPPVAEGATAAPAPPDRCKTPGPPAKIDLAARRRVAADQRACLPASLRDAAGCEVRGAIAWQVVLGQAEVDDRGCVRVPAGAAQGDRIRVAATSGAIRSESTLTVASEEEAAQDTSSLLARDPLPTTATDAPRAAGGEGSGGVRAVVPSQSHGSDLLLPILIIAALLLVVLAMVLLLVVRTQKKPEPAPQRAASRTVASAIPADAPDSRQVCPTCREEFGPGSAFCPHDATRLVPKGSEPERPTLGSICPRCHRGYEPGTKTCSADGEELVPYAIAQIARPRHGGRGETAKICPVCSSRYDVDATFCGKDGSELVLVN